MLSRLIGESRPCTAHCDPSQNYCPRITTSVRQVHLTYFAGLPISSTGRPANSRREEFLPFSTLLFREIRSFQSFQIFSDHSKKWTCWSSIRTSLWVTDTATANAVASSILRAYVHAITRSKEGQIFIRLFLTPDAICCRIVLQHATSKISVQDAVLRLKDGFLTADALR